jgi:hypothetical protein
MKTIPALLVVAALTFPAFAQNAALQRNAELQEIQNRLKGPVVIPAFKPILLHTGKPITKNDKAQLVTSVAQISAANVPVQKWQKSNIKIKEAPVPTATQVTVSPSQMFQNDIVYAEAVTPEFVNPGLNSLLFKSGENSALDIFFKAEANMSYILTFKVSSSSSNPQFKISGSVGGYETFTGSSGSNEFAYVMVANSAGTLNVDLYSTNSYWKFESCEITGTPIN